MSDSTGPPRRDDLTELFLRWRETGNKALFDDLAKRMQARLVAQALRLCADEHRCLDFVQETFLRMWQAAEQYQPTRAAVGTWANGILLNLIMTWLRSRYRESRRPLVPGVNDGQSREAPPGEQVERDEAVAELHRHLAGLSPEHREVLIQQYILGMGLDESAAALGISRGAVGSRRFAAVKRLRERMQPPPDEGQASGCGPG